jgi:hypothetical protein
VDLGGSPGSVDAQEHLVYYRSGRSQIVNKRIQELIEQATSVTEPDDPDYRFEIFDHKKFAELIIRECMSYLEQDGDIDFAKFMIKQNFGVEL